MSYAVKEIFYTLQGEGMHTGRAAVFCRFAGCNLWTGREEDRATAVCRFCDTDFVGGDKIGAAGQLAVAIRQRWAADHMGQPFVVLTGGEPTLQVDQALLDELHALNCYVAMETNGTHHALKDIDWITVSPKAGSDVVQKAGHELKVIWPQSLDLEELERWSFPYRILQPMDGYADALAITTAECLKRPRWRLGLQTHKILGIR